MASKDKAAPTEAPPSYAESQATGGSTASRPSKPTHLEIPTAVNGIPAASRRSMEDEVRPLPQGWIRQFDANEHHQFFVDTRADPPRSIWVHPYDDEQYLSTLSSEERERIQEEESKLRRPLTPASVDEKSLGSKPSSAQHQSFPEQLPPRPGRNASHDASSGKKKGLGERFKEKATGMTKEERQREREKRAEEERQYYEQHQRFRSALARAQQTGQPQFFSKDRDGHDVFIEPPAYGGYGYGGGYGDGQRTFNPYQSSELYSNPNNRFIRPQQPYGRPYGGYGGGYGYGLPLAGGLLGGALLGAALF